MSDELFLTELMSKIHFPQEAQEIFLALYQRILHNPEYNNSMKSAVQLFIHTSSEKAFAEIDKLSVELKEHSYTMSMLLLLLCAKPLMEKYSEKGLPEDIYWDSIKDLGYKLKECHHIYGIWGTFVRDWFPGYYQMSRFALGRMQYECASFSFDSVTINGITIKSGDKVLMIHIPSSGSFTKEERLESYHKAKDFYRKEFDNQPIPVVCDSWLLYPAYKEVFPIHSNIRSFIDDFSYIYEKTEEEFLDAWRLFGSDYNKSPKDWPQTTSLQKAFAEYFISGGKAGIGYGIFIL
nr:acyltransferase domain-containing protein [uncultured Anaerocolumna sp.]